MLLSTLFLLSIVKELCLVITSINHYLIYGKFLTAFEQSLSPFDSSQSVFERQNKSSNNPFAPKPFGSPTPFASQTGNFMFGDTSTCVFGAAQTSSPFSSNTTFGASSSPAFGNSMPAFGASSTLAFGSSAFGQKTAVGGFGSTPTQTSPFGSATQPSQPAISICIFCSLTPFSTSSQPSFGSTSTPAFDATSNPAFGSTSTPAFDSTWNAFCMSSAPISPAFGASSTPAFSFGSSTQAFGQSSSAFGTSSPFGSTTSAFGGPNSAFGSQTPTPAFGNTGQSGFGGQRGGSRVASYTATTEADSGTSGQIAKLESISAMPVYRDKSHEELRWEDYQLGDKGGPLASAPQPTGMASFNTSTTQTNAFSPAPVFGQPSSANPFSSTTPNSNPFGQNTSTFSAGFGNSTPAFSSGAFGSSTSAAAPSIFGSSTSPSPFGANPSSQAFGSSTSLFNTAAQGTSSPFGSSIFGNTQPSQLFSSSAPTNAQSGSAFGQNTSPFGQSSGFSQSSLFSSPSSGLVGSIFSSSASLTSNTLTGFGQTAPSMSTPFQSAQPAQSSGTFAFSNNFGQTQPAGGSSFSGTPGMFGQNNFGLQAVPQSSMVAQAAPITNPFGTLPALPQMSIGRVGTTPSVQYGISSMASQDKPATVRISSLLTSRHLSQRRVKFPIRKYKNEGSKVPFFSDDEDTPTTPKADALFIPRENPRALIISPMEQWPGRASEKASSFKDRYTSVNGNGISSRDAGTAPNDKTGSENKEKTAAENGVVKEQVQPVPTKHASNGSNEDHSPQKVDMYKTLSGHRAGSQTPTPAFGNTGQSGFGGQRGGSRVASYTATTEADSGSSGQIVKFESISAMHVYKDKSHEELRWEDYQLVDKGSQTPTPSFGNTGIGKTGIGGQWGGSRIASYSATTEVDSTAQTGKFESISLMPVYRDKSHEELRWEDYQLGDKDGSLASAAPQSTGMTGFNSSTTQTNIISHMPVFDQSSVNPFSSAKPNSNPFAPKTSTFSSAFGSSAPAFSSSAFGSSTSEAAPSIFVPSTSPFGANSLSQAFWSSASLFNTAFQGTSSPFGPSLFGNTQPSQLYSSAAPTNAQSASAFGHNISPFGQTSGFSQSSLFGLTSSGLVGIFYSSSASPTSIAQTGFGRATPSMPTPFQSTQVHNLLSLVVHLCLRPNL